MSSAKGTVGTHLEGQKQLDRFKKQKDDAVAASEKGPIGGGWRGGQGPLNHQYLNFILNRQEILVWGWREMETKEEHDIFYI